MEAYARHSRFHSRAPPPPHFPAGGEAGSYKNGFMAYDDVFGGAPKFGATAPFAPRAEDYSEIFGSFRSSRASSIPMLDLPPVDDSAAAFDVVGRPGFGYHEIFGGFGFADFAVSYDELFRRSDGSEESSDDAWTPVGSQSLSGESDPSACSGRNQYFLSDDVHQTHDNEFNASPREVNLETTEDSDRKHGTRLSDVPGYSYVVEGLSSEMRDKELYSPGIADDIVLCEDSSGNILVETNAKTLSDLSRDFDQNAGRAPGIGLSPNLVSVSDVSLAAESPDMPSSPRVPTRVVDRKKDPLRSTSNCEHRNVNAAEITVDCGSFDFFDVEIDAAGSSALASEAVVKEAMERSKVKMRKAKELVEKKKDTNGHEMLRIVSNESTSRDDELQSTYGSKSDLFQTSEKAMQYASEASQGSPDCLQVEDGVNGAAEPSHRKNIKEQSPVQEQGITEEAGDWKVAAQYYELVNDCNPKFERALLDNANKFAQIDDYYRGNASAKTMSHKQPKQGVEGVSTCTEENGDLKPARETCDPRKNRRRLRATKAASRQNLHERMVKVAQVVDETVTFGQVEAMKEAKEGIERDGADRNLRGFDQSAQQEFELAESEMRSKEDAVEAFSKKKEIGACRPEEREVHGMGLNGAHQIEGKEEVCTRKEAEARKRVESPVNENLAMLNAPLENGEDAEKSGRDEKQNSDMRLKRSDEECREREDEIWGKEASETKVKDTQKTDQCKESVDEATMADCCESKVKGSVEPEKADKKLEGSDGTSNEESENEISKKEGTVNTIQPSEFEKHQKMCEDSAVNGGRKMDHKADMQSEPKSNGQNSCHGTHLHVESEFTSLIGSCVRGENRETNDKVSEVNCEPEQLKYSNSAATPDEKYIKPITAAFECKVKPENYAAEDAIVIEAESEADEDICMSPKHFQKTEAAQPTMSVRKENLQKQYVSSNLNHRFGEDGKAINGSLAAEDRGKAENSKRGGETERKRLGELELEREKELEKEHIRKQEGERERERVKELEKLRLRRLEELREREREKELEKFRLRNLEEERQREREKDSEIARQRKLEEEWERQREREKDRMGMELKTSLAREKAEKVAAEREAVESRQRAMAEARERLEKACAEARGKSLSERASAEARLRAERAAVERAASEARERAIEKAMAERATFEGRERVERSVSEKFSSTFRDERLRHCSSSSNLWNSDKSYGAEGESAQRSKARMERHRRTVERVAKALAEKNTRDLVAQREQAERNRLAETLDGDIKRWSNGKEGNLRALLSTLQYILGPDGGWQPIPLTEVITSAAVKKAYRKATLCVHPDKLQQRGATIQQKYICEKVFDLLKEAWNKFNSEER